MHEILIDIIYKFYDTPLNDDHLKMIKVPKKVEGCRDCLLYIFFINFKISRDALHQFSLRTIRDIKVRYPVSFENRLLQSPIQSSFDLTGHYVFTHRWTDCMICFLLFLLTNKNFSRAKYKYVIHSKNCKIYFLALSIWKESLHCLLC